MFLRIRDTWSFQGVRGFGDRLILRNLLTSEVGEPSTEAIPEVNTADMASTGGVETPNKNQT